MAKESVMVKGAKVKKSDIWKWIRALRSGNYKQGQGTLENESHEFCCLGVACKVFIPTSKQYFCPDTKIRHLNGALPSKQMSSPEWLLRVNKDVHDKLGRSLVKANDGFQLTAYGNRIFLNFDEIADILQALYIEEVLG